MTRLSALAGIRVLDATQVMAGPFCAMMLADLGADVIKIEPPAGDSTRQMPDGVDGDTPAFNAVNRGKRSVRLNLKSPEGRAVFERLSRSTDILIENYRPGVMNALGLGYTDLSSANPRLIYASISGYGQTGPERHKGGFDLIAQGVSGIMSITGEPGHAPVKAGVPITDLGAGLFALVGILAALESRHRTDAGQHIDTSLVDAGVALSVWKPGIRCRSGVPGYETGAPMNAPYQAIDAGRLHTIGRPTVCFTVCNVLGHPEWKETLTADNAARGVSALLAERIEGMRPMSRAPIGWAFRTAGSVRIVNDYARCSRTHHHARHGRQVEHRQGARTSLATKRAARRPTSAQTRRASESKRTTCWRKPV